MEKVLLDSWFQPKCHWEPLPLAHGKAAHKGGSSVEETARGKPDTERQKRGAQAPKSPSRAHPDNLTSPTDPTSSKFPLLQQCHRLMTKPLKQGLWWAFIQTLAANYGWFNKTKHTAVKGVNSNSLAGSGSGHPTVLWFVILLQQTQCHSSKGVLELQSHQIFRPKLVTVCKLSWGTSQEAGSRADPPLNTSSHKQKTQC